MSNINIFNLDFSKSIREWQINNLIKERENLNNAILSGKLLLKSMKGANKKTITSAEKEVNEILLNKKIKPIKLDREYVLLELTMHINCCLL